MFDIKEELKKLPDKPGVYLMHDKTDTVIYVGKAVVLKNRVRQYFQKSRNVSPKIEKMISQIARFEYIVTDSEVEALVLESNLIKEYTPKYNTMLRDDKSYPFIKATVGERFPRLLLTRSKGKEKNSAKVRYFGPYTSAGAAKDMLGAARKIYHIRSCNRKLPETLGEERACLNYHIKQCDAPCQGLISEEDYKKNFEAALRFINGDYKLIIETLEKKMTEASENLDFEDAASYRDLITNIKKAMVHQKITSFDSVDRDFIAMAKDKNQAVVQMFYVREGKVIGRENFHMDEVSEEEDSTVIGDFIKQYYRGTPYIPREIVIEEEIEDVELIEKWLSERKHQKVSIVVPKKGQKEKLALLAHKNAELTLQKEGDRLKKEAERTVGAMQEIMDWLGLKDIHRVESYDISNTSGFQSVGSMIVFEDGKPKKSDYRKFKIMSVKGPDDYKSMEEILTRRFEHGLKDKERDADSQSGFARFPDLIMMDGGKGQVNVALRVLDKLKINIPVCGLVKDDKHRTRGIYFNNEELPIDIHAEGFWLITRIQDEVHRFAIEFHRSLRSKVQVKSSLDDIKGVGPKRRRALLKYFKGVEELKNASVEDIMQVESMDRKTAENIYKFFKE
ncbi:MAG: excinuclease ABC subunit UvrC [Lachnospiraceae bacterium]|nr:excinuclease ABC subunit UvrC [Lachnospiraceae bacterium]